MRILWLAPWFRTLGVAWTGGLRDLGHEVLLITSDMHFEKTPVAAGDLVLSHPWRTPAGAKEGAAAVAAARRFAPDVVVIEAVRDPRFIAAAAATRAPWVRQTHDFAPHDAANRAQVAHLMRRVNEAALERRCAAEVCFSENVAGKLRTVRSAPVHVVPLTSEMSESLTPDFVAAQGRRDFLLIGRMSAYKNVALAIEAYQAHRAGPGYRGDSLVLIGKGDPECPVPPEVQWVNDTFDFADLAPRLAAAKASLVTYTAASQSGVQVTDMQCGTTTLVSDRGGLAEYLPPGETPVSIDGPAELTARFDLLADPDEAERAGRRSSQEYERRFSVAASSRRWADVLAAAVGRSA